MKKPKRPLSFRRRKKIVLKILKQVKKLAEDNDDEAYVIYVDLMIEHMRLLENESECTQELYLQIIARTFDHKFKEFIFASSKADVYGWELTSHNVKVQAEFILAGINFQKWLKYDAEEDIEAREILICKNKDLSWKVLQRNLDLLLVFLEKTQLYGSLRKDCIEIQKQKALILNGDYLVQEEWKETLFPKFYLTCNHLSRSASSFTLNGTAEDFNLVQNRIKSMLNAFSKNSLKKEFRVLLWRRDPQFDLLQGNFSDCCVAIGVKSLYPAVHLPEVNCRKFPAGILNYLTDLGVQVAEVHDISSGTNQQIGQCWLFVSLDDDGKPVLMADSFDLHSEYRVSESQRSAIRECMFNFLKKYASQCGITKVILGKSGPILKNFKRHEVHNGVSVENLTIVNFQKRIEKLGGYFLNRPYFLETRGGKSAYLVADNLPVTLTEKTEEMIMRVWEYISTRAPVHH